MDLWQLVSDALTEKNKFWLIKPLENDGYVVKARTI